MSKVLNFMNKMSTEKKDRKSSHRITLINISENETFRYSLPIIKGYVTIVNERFIATNGTISLKRFNSADSPEEETNWPVIDGHFKCLANLLPGRNRFLLEYENSRLYLNLEFQLKTTSYHVLPVYIICSGSDGHFQSPEDEDNSPQSACRRIDLGSRLIQSLTAEKLREMGMTRRTFQLARDLDSGMKCIVFVSKLKPDEVYDMKPEEIWEHFGRELMSSDYGSERRKFLAFLSCTRYLPCSEEPQTHEEVIARMRGHVALGGGGLAVFGTGCLHTWPEYVHQILSKFNDETKVNKSKYMDDSCYRGTFGGCFSTTLGAVCHELGHAFDLGHCKKGIMGRGFDNVNLVFTTAHQSKDANKNMIKNDGQHATVSFSRNLNVTYTVSSPIKKPKGSFHSIKRFGSPQKRIAAESHSVDTWNPRCWSLNENEKAFYSQTETDDLTFWEKNCAVLLRYHRWFSNEDVPLSSCVEYDQERKTIRSTSGIRVVEIRGDDGLVLMSWEFLKTFIPKQFKLPLSNANLKDAKMIVAEDSSGNILKYSLTGR